MKKPEKEKILENYFLGYDILRNSKELYLADSSGNGYGAAKDGTVTIQKTNYADTKNEIITIGTLEYNKALHKNMLYGGTAQYM